MKKATCSRASPSENRRANAWSEISFYPLPGDILKKWGVTNSCPVIQEIVRRINLRNEPSCFHPVGLFNLFLWLGFFLSFFFFLYFIFSFFSSRVMDANAQLWFNDREKIFFFFFFSYSSKNKVSYFYLDFVELKFWMKFPWNLHLWDLKLFRGWKLCGIYIYIARFKGCYLELYFLQNDNTTGKWKLSLENDRGILYVLPGRDEGYFWPYRVQRRTENSV